MKIGIIVYSRTGHTLSVAQALEEKLAAAGHTVVLERLEAVGPVSPGATDIQLKHPPAIEAYEGLAFGSPAWGGMPAPPVTRYLEQIDSLEGKTVVCLATGVFPAGWGRNQTLARMEEMCESKGATVVGSGSVGWLSFGRKRQIAEAVDSLSSLF